MNSIQNIVLFAVVITYLKKPSPRADLLPHTFGVTPWSKKKGTCTHSINFFCPFFLFLAIYLFIFFFTEPGFKLLGEKKEKTVTISINISWLTFQEQEKSYLEKVVVNGVIRSGFLAPKACEVLYVKFYGRIVPKMRQICPPRRHC